MNRRSFIPLCILAVLLAACGDDNAVVDPSGSPNISFTTGGSVELVTATIPASGGTVKASKPGDPLDGFTIEVPDSAYQEARTFHVSYAPITEYSLPEGYEPGSPMISIENGGGYAEDVMIVRIPMKVPAGYDPVACYYDRTTKEITGIPVIHADSNMVVIMTRHFTDVQILLAKNVDYSQPIVTGFLPGRDDWHFPNVGTAVTPAGNCSGIATTELWYFLRKMKPTLYRRYDNVPSHDGSTRPTPDKWQDDRNALRLVAMAQIDQKGLERQTIGNANTVAKKEAGKRFSEWVFKSFYNHMKLSRLPQWIGMDDAAAHAHAMVVYKIVDYTLYVADPNRPGERNHTIRFDKTAGVLEPYSAAPGDPEAITYTRFLFASSGLGSAMINLERIEQRWREFEQGTIGDGTFPSYDANVLITPASTYDVQEYTSTDTIKGRDWVYDDTRPSRVRTITVAATYPSQSKAMRVAFCNGVSGPLSTYGLSADIPLSVDEGKPHLIGVAIALPGAAAGDDPLWLDFVWVEWAFEKKKGRWVIEWSVDYSFNCSQANPHPFGYADYKLSGRAEFDINDIGTAVNSKVTLDDVRLGGVSNCPHPLYSPWYSDPVVIRSPSTNQDAKMGTGSGFHMNNGTPTDGNFTLEGTHVPAKVRHRRLKPEPPGGDEEVELMSPKWGVTLAFPTITDGAEIDETPVWVQDGVFHKHAVLRKLP